MSANHGLILHSLLENNFSLRAPILPPHTETWWYTALEQEYCDLQIGNEYHFVFFPCRLLMNQTIYIKRKSSTDHERSKTAASCCCCPHPHGNLGLSDAMLIKENVKINDKIQWRSDIKSSSLWPAGGDLHPLRAWPDSGTVRWLYMT